MDSKNRTVDCVRDICKGFFFAIAGAAWLMHTGCAPADSTPEPSATQQKQDAQDESRQQEHLLKMAADIQRQAEHGSVPVSAAIQEITEIKAKAEAGKRTQDILEERLEHLKALHKEEIDAAIAVIREKVWRKSASRQEQAALDYLKTYSGPHREETATARAELAQKIKKSILERKEQRAMVLRTLAQEVLKGDLQTAAQHASAADERLDLEDTVTLLQSAAKCFEELLNSFRAQMGDMIRVGIAGKARRVKIVGINNGQLIVATPVNGALKNKLVPLQYLDPQECRDRLVNVPRSAQNLYLGVLALERKDLKAAGRLWAETDSLADDLTSLVSNLESRAPAGSARSAPSPSEPTKTQTDSPHSDQDQDQLMDGKPGQLEKLLFASQARAHDCGIARELAVASIIEGKVDDAKVALGTFVKKYFDFVGDKALYKTSEIEAISSVCDAWLVLSNCFAKQTIGMKPKTVKWLLADNHRLRLVAEATRKGVVWPRAAEIIEELYQHAPDSRDEYFELILAFAVVWDTPRPRLHHQTGGHELSYEPNLPERYDYFSKLYTTGNSKIPYERLAWWTLTFVVDTPVPISELKWARKNVRGSLYSWGDKFSDIEYAQDRLDAGLHDWANGPYTLAAIEDRGGICVDQAYYGAMTARALGIPAVQFSGRGKRGYHAWFGYMTNEQNWELEAGRYEYDEYTVGRTRAPRTNAKMTDHEAAFACDPVFQSREYYEACRYSRIAEICNKFQLDKSLPVFIEKTLRRVELDLKAWELKEAYIRRTGDDDDLLRMFDRRLETFRRYHDHLCDVMLRKAEVLQESGREKEAQELLANAQRRFARQRFDLAEKVFTQRLKLYQKSDDTSAEMKLLEEYLEDNDEQGSKLLPYVKKYIDVAQNAGQSKACVRFLKRFVRRVDTDAATRQKFRQLQLKAEKNM